MSTFTKKLTKVKFWPNIKFKTPNDTNKKRKPQNMNQPSH